ncbi:MAG: hypothetical protein QF827_05335 [Alphaproteobacteria bacterium]|jgi:hypothetical protein|nr:hypothetical protein [Alphaproteobacteria bacterium]|tara:strand:+ start:63 stop:353 length:291 start_codon:yes stop_codon:yes gene_type:complete
MAAILELTRPEVDLDIIGAGPRPEIGAKPADMTTQAGESPPADQGVVSYREALPPATGFAMRQSAVGSRKTHSIFRASAYMATMVPYVGGTWEMST